MRKISWRLGAFFIVMVLLLSAFPMDVRAADEVWIEISDMAGLISIGSNPSGNYRLTADIDLGGAEWSPIGPFSGKLDGNSKVIRNFTINDTSVPNKGLFSSIEASGQISNLGIENANITAGSNAGIMAGTNSGTISRSYTKGSVNGFEYVGGLVGQNLGTIENSFTRANVSGKDYLGGLAGANSGTVGNSYAASSVLPSIFNNYLDFNGTSGYIDIEHMDAYVGDQFTLEAWFQWDDTNTGEVNFIMGKGYEQFEIHTGGGSGVNGLRFIPVWNENGDSWLDIKNVIQPGWFHVAAVYEYNPIEKSAAARVYVNGEAQDLWRGSVNLGKVATLSRPTNTLGYEKVSGEYVQKQSPINIGRRTDGSYYFDGKICDVRFWNIARTGEDIKRDKDKVLTGNETGLVGYWKLNEASGDAIDSSTTHNNGILAGGVTRTSETAATHKGGLIGQNTGIVSDSYYDSEVSGQSDSTGTSNSTADMKLESTFTDWDFSNVWGVDSGKNAGYPYLLSEISTASVTVTAPAAGAIPQTAVQVETATSNADYTVSNIVWNEALAEDNRFKAGQVYTANVTLTSKNGKMFQTEAFTPSVAGSASVGTTTANGTGAGNTVTFVVTFQATAAAPYEPPSGRGSHSTPTVPAQSPNTGVDVLVNGKTETAATATTTQEGAQTVTTVTVDDKKIEEKLQAEGNNATVTIPVNSNSDVVVGQLNGQTVKNMEIKEAVLEIKTENVTYTLPAAQINIDNISEQIGRQVELKDIKVNVVIAAPPQNTVKIVEDTANKNNYQVVVKPVEFDITCTSGNKTLEISKFNGYVERTVAIPDGMDPSKITTGIVLNSDGTFSHVPTAIIIIDGKYYARINSLTNSTYSVIYSPETFKDAEKHWARDAINDMGSRLIISGVGNNSFEPDRNITRSEFASIVVRALGLMRQGTGKASFSDVSKEDSYYDAVSIAYENGIISGYGNGKFRPSDKITREQAMTMIARAMKITGLKPEINDSEASSLLVNYVDGTSAKAYAKTSMAACVKTGVVAGRSGSTIAPKGYITRAESAAVIQRLLQKSNLI